MQKEITKIESRQQELMLIMTQSDAHASKCAKLGLSFKDEYPKDYEAYVSANEEYNRNEQELMRLHEAKAQQEEALEERGREPASVG